MSSNTDPSPHSPDANPEVESSTPEASVENPTPPAEAQEQIAIEEVEALDALEAALKPQHEHIHALANIISPTVLKYLKTGKLRFVSLLCVGVDNSAKTLTFAVQPPKGLSPDAAKAFQYQQILATNAAAIEMARSSERLRKKYEKGIEDLISD